MSFLVILKYLSWDPFLDVTTCNLPMGSKLSLYADDMLLYKPIRSDGDYTDLQSDIDNLYKQLDVF